MNRLLCKMSLHVKKKYIGDFAVACGIFASLEHNVSTLPFVLEVRLPGVNQLMRRKFILSRRPSAGGGGWYYPTAYLSNQEAYQNVKGCSRHLSESTFKHFFAFSEARNPGQLQAQGHHRPFPIACQELTNNICEHTKIILLKWWGRCHKNKGLVLSTGRGQVQVT